MRKVRTVDLMTRYFQDIGQIPSRSEYIKMNDGPLRLPAIKRACGSWSRMLSICEKTHPDRMAAARVGKVPVKQEPTVQEPIKREAPPAITPRVVTAAEALRKLKESQDEE